jgi:class 3 adenylate cyclase
MVVCPACGQENPGGFRFCGAYAALLAGGPPQRVERKFMAALFCDLVGSTARGERLEAESMSAV